MDIKEVLNTKLEGLGNQIDSKIEEALEAQKANLNNELDNLKANELSALTSSYNKLQEQVDSIETSAKRNSGERVAKNWIGSLVEQIKSNEGFSSQVRTNKGAEFSVPMFKAETVLTGSADYVDSTTSNNVVPPDYQPGIVFDPDRAEHVRQFLPQGTTTSDLVRFVQESNFSNGTEVKPEGTAITNSTNFDLEVKEAPVRTIAAYTRLSSEMLDDVAGLTAYLSARLPKKVRVKEDNVLLYGSDSPVFTGITESAAAYTDALADSNVNRFDVLTSAIAQVRDGEYQANAIMIHPDDFYNLLLVKDTNGLYLMPDAFRFGAQAPRIAGVPVIASTAITTGDFLVGDFSLGAQVFDRQQSSIRFYEQDQNNAIRGLITVVASERIAMPIYRPNAFIYGTFAAALANGSA